jgi:hypothetical protein
MKTIPKRDAIKTITTHYIDGAFVESHGREVMDIVRPTDGQVIAHVTLADEEDTRRAIAAVGRKKSDPTLPSIKIGLTCARTVSASRPRAAPPLARNFLNFIDSPLRRALPRRYRFFRPS